MSTDLTYDWSERGPFFRFLLFWVHVGRLVRMDIGKLLGYWVIIAGYAAMAGIGMLGAYLVYHLEQAARLTSGSGYAFAISLMIRCVDFGAPIIFVLLCILFALEVSNQTVKCILTRPITRLELIASKYITAMLMILAALLIFAVIGLATGKYYYGLGDLVENEYVIFSSWYMYKQMLIGFALLFLPFMTLAALALMVSAFSSTMGGSIIIALIWYFFFQIIGLIPNSLGFHVGDHFFPYMTFGFPSQRWVPLYMLDDLPTGIPIDTWWTWDIQKMIIICGIFFAVFFITSIITVKKRDFVL